jgi:hypothetical protein
MTQLHAITQMAYYTYILLYSYPEIVSWLGANPTGSLARFEDKNIFLYSPNVDIIDCPNLT